MFDIRLVMMRGINEFCNKVADIHREKPKCSSYRGVRLIEAIQNLHVLFYVTLQISLYAT